MYKDYFELSEKPFNSETPDTRFLFYTSVHKRALERVFIGVSKNEERLLLVYGPIGSGKTTLARRLFQLLKEEEGNTLAMVLSPSYRTENALLRAIMGELEVKTSRSYAASLRSLEEFVVSTDKTPIVFIDEAQALKPKMFELLRHLHNFVGERGGGLRMILFAQDEIITKIKKNPAFQSRIRTKRALDTLDLADTQEVISNRWSLAGGKKLPFTDDAIKAINEHSGGIVRKIVSIADESLIQAFASKKKTISAEDIKTAVESLYPEELENA